MRRALLAGIIVSLAAGAMGAYVVLKGLAFLGDAVAHTQLAGAAIALALGGGAILITLGAAAAAAITALGVALLTMRGRLRQDTAIGILFVGFFALGVILISRQRTFAIDLGALLVGNILGPSWGDLLVMSVLAGIVLAATALFFQELKFAAYDPEMAQLSGVPVAAVRVGMLVLIALATVVAFRLVGVVLALAMLVAPATAATLLVYRVSYTMLLAALFGILSTVIGLYLSFHFNLAAGPSIVIVSVILVGVVWAVAPRGMRQSLRRAPDAVPSPHHHD